jgi:hypothetical protein
MYAQNRNTDLMEKVNAAERGASRAEEKNGRYRKEIMDLDTQSGHSERSIHQGECEDAPALRKIRTSFDLLGIQDSEKEVKRPTRREWNEPLAGDGRRLPEWIDAQIRELEQSTPQPYSP